MTAHETSALSFLVFTFSNTVAAILFLWEGSFILTAISMMAACYALVQAYFAMIHAHFYYRMRGKYEIQSR